MLNANGSQNGSVIANGKSPAIVVSDVVMIGRKRSDISSDCTRIYCASYCNPRTSENCKIICSSKNYWSCRINKMSYTKNYWKR